MSSFETKLRRAAGVPDDYAAQRAEQQAAFDAGFVLDGKPKSPPSMPPPTVLRGELAAASPWQKLAQKKFDASMRPSVPAQLSEEDRQAMLAQLQQQKKVPFGGPQGL